MSIQDETAGSAWYGINKLRVSDDSATADVSFSMSDRWDRAHLRRLRQSADLPGLVPVINAEVTSDGKAFSVAPAISEPTLAEKIPAAQDWRDNAGILEAAARAIHEAHLRGLFGGAISPKEIYVIGDDVAVSGMGLGLGGNPRPGYEPWVSPEVMRGEDASERSDIYSLGKILEAILGDDADDVPRSIRRLMMWSGSEAPEARLPSAKQFADDLAEAIGQDRKVYGPAFIPTAEIAHLAGPAAEAVSAHEGGFVGESDVASLATDSGQEIVGSPPAATTVDFEDGLKTDGRGSRSGILIGALLVGLVGFVAWQFMDANDTGSELSTPAGGTEEAELEAPSTADTDQDDSVSHGYESAAAAVAVAGGPILANEAGVQLVHGIPAMPVDVYVDGEALVPGFNPAQVAGPAKLDPGTYLVEVYAASANPPAKVTDRTDQVLTSESLVVEADPVMAVVHYGSDDQATITFNSGGFEKIKPGKGRVSIYHVANAGEVMISIDENTVSDGVMDVNGSFTTELEAGSHTITMSDTAGELIYKASLNMDDGEMNVLYLVGPSDDLEVVMQAFTGLASAPNAVATGNTGLLGQEPNSTGVYLLVLMAVLMALVGGVVHTRRNRVL